MEKVPQRIEVYDNSHIQGAHAVGAMIVAGPDGFDKNQYRKFNIKDDSLTPGDDFGEHNATRYVRLSFATEISRLKEGLTRMKRFVEPYIR